MSTTKNRVLYLKTGRSLQPVGSCGVNDPYKTYFDALKQHHAIKALNEGRPLPEFIERLEENGVEVTGARNG